MLYLCCAALTALLETLYEKGPFSSAAFSVSRTIDHSSNSSIIAAAPPAAAAAAPAVIFTVITVVTAVVASALCIAPYHCGKSFGFSVAHSIA
jgi:predicted membrane channel-forming protein YqfA (hemolysin III family)